MWVYIEEIQNSQLNTELGKDDAGPQEKLFGDFETSEGGKQNSHDRQEYDHHAAEALSNKHCRSDCKNNEPWALEMWLSAFPEDLGSILSIQMAAHNHV